MEFRLLGPLEVVADNGAVLPLGGPRPRAVLALLLLDANEVVSKDRLIDGVWGESPPPSAPGALQVHIHALRKVLGADRIVTRPPGYMLRVETGELDRNLFELLVEEATPDALRAALALWRGPALADVAYEAFAQAETARLEERRLSALAARIDLDLNDGNHADVVGELDALVARYPHRERFHAQRMLALYRSGRQADALAAYRDARSVLAELGLDPAPELRALEQRILRQDPGLDGRTARHQPEPGSELIGRDLEVAALLAMVRSGSNPLVTITGTAGVGKTSVARAVAGTATVVELASIEDPELVAGEIARALGCTEEPTRALSEVIAETISERRELIVLDNFEHVLSARDLVASIIDRSQDAQLLVTSRVPLRLASEREYRLRPLELPEPGEDDVAQLAGVPAVELYVARAREAVRTFELTEQNATAIARICRLLDGLPLALELAAARVRALGPDATAARLGEGIALLRNPTADAPERQRSVRAAIDWSYRLLDRAEQRWFRAMGVLAGGGSLELVEAVLPGEDASDALDALIDASLVVHSADENGEPRFSLLQPIREYALELLDGHEELTAVRLRHLAFLLELAEIADERRRRDLASYPIDRFRLEIDNFRAALDHAARSGDSYLLARLTCALAVLWTLDESFQEGLGRFEAAHAVIEEIDSSVLRFGILNGLALFSYFGGDLSRALDLNERALDVGGDAIDPGDAGRALRLRSAIANATDRPLAALEALERAIPLLEAAGDRASAGRSLFTLADAHRRAGDYGAAIAEGTRSAEVLGSIGDQEGELFAWLVVAAAHVTAGADGDAVEAIIRALDGAERVGDVASIETATLLVARIAAVRGELRLAARMLGFARAAFARLGVARWEIEREYWEPIEAALRDELPADEWSALDSDGATTGLDVMMSLVRESLAAWTKSLQARAAVGDQRGAGDVRGVVGHQPGDERGDLRRSR